MADLDKLRSDYEKAEQHAQKLQADKDDAIAKVRDQYGDRLRKANDDAAEAQKKLADAEAAAALIGRDDAETVAANLGLELPEQE
jgi:DNA anti-recombination protein RmuC